MIWSVRSSAHGLLITVLAAVSSPSASGATEGPLLDVCVVSPISGTPILASTTFSTLQCSSSVGVVATPGEDEPASLVIRSRALIGDLTVSVGDLVGESARIGHHVVDIKYVKVWYQAGTAWKSIKNTSPGRVLVPELLLNDDALIRVDTRERKNYLRLSNGAYIDISANDVQLSSVALDTGRFTVSDSPSLLPLQLPPNESKQIWLTISVPINSSPGVYRGVVTLSSPGAGLQTSVPISVRVLPFKLSNPVIEYSIYYRGQLDPTGRGAISSELKSSLQLRADFTDMRRHGVTNPTIYQESGGASAFQELLSLRREAGISNERLYHLGINSGDYSSPSAMRLQYERFKALQGVARAAGAKEFFVYGVDEAEPGAIRAQRAVWDKFHRLGAKMFVAAYEFREAEAQYAGRIDTVVLGIPPTRTSIASLQSGGTRVFLYSQPQIGLEDPAIYRLNYGLNAWAFGFDGVMNYAYQHAMGSIWNDFDHPQFRDHVFAYPTSDGVVDTIAWEGFREGVDDVRYLSTLIELSRLSPGKAGEDLLKGIHDAGVRNPADARAQIINQILSICGMRRTSGEVDPICLR